MRGAASNTCTVLCLKAASSVCQRQREPVRGPLLLENTVAQEAGVLDLRLAGPAGGARGRRMEEATETGSATEMGVKAGCYMMVSHWERSLIGCLFG